MKDVQQQGGSYTSQASLIGLIRQLTIDTTNWRILLHDGETPGGVIFLSANEGDARWMEKIPELSGFADFVPGAKGIPVRTANGVYVLRGIAGTGGQIIITNPLGTGGNFTISLPDEITKDLLFSGTISFGSVIQAVGLIGDTQGDHTGNVQGDVVGNVTGNLTGNSSGTHTGPQVGAVDARGHAVQFDDDAISIAKVAGLQDAIDAIPSGVPTGCILMWSGDSSDVPTGWLLCDGTSGTPDLRDRFVACAGPENTPHETGGSYNYTPAGAIAAGGTHAHSGVADDHALTLAEIPAHTHTTPCGIAEGDTATNFTNGNNTLGAAVSTSSVGSGGPHSHTLTLDDGGSHSHAFTGAVATVVPPYYALCYIMKG